jgi:hypothetical protein
MRELGIVRYDHIELAPYVRVVTSGRVPGEDDSARDVPV